MTAQNAAAAPFNLAITGFTLSQTGDKTPFRLNQENIKTPYQLSLKNGVRMGFVSGSFKKTILEFGLGDTYSSRGE